MTVCKALVHAVGYVLATSAIASAQAHTRVQVGVGLLGAAPLGDFGTNIGSAGGVSGHLDVGLGDGMVSVGAEAAYLLYGSASRKVDLGDLIPELPATVKVTTDNQMVLVLGRVRVQARRGRLRPYADGLVGFNYIFTTTSLEGSDCSDGSSCSLGVDVTNLDDLVPTLGVGAGILWDVASPGGTRLDFSVRYLAGGKADYLREGAIRTQGGEAFLNISRSRTDMLLVYFGVNFGR